MLFPDITNRETSKNSLVRREEYITLDVDFLRYPSVIWNSGKKSKVVFLTDYAYVEVLNPLSVLSFKLLVLLIRMGKVKFMNDEVVRLSVEFSKVKKALNTRNSKVVYKKLKEIIACSYAIHKKSEFKAFNLALRIEANEMSGTLEVSLERKFYDFCLRGLLVDSEKILELKTPFAINLYLFLVANSRLKRVRESTLFQRVFAGMENIPKKEKRRHLRKALTKLKEISFIEDYEEKSFLNERYYLIKR